MEFYMSGKDEKAEEYIYSRQKESKSYFKKEQSKWDVVSLTWLCVPVQLKNRFNF